MTLDGQAPGSWAFVEDVSPVRELAREVEVARRLAVTAAQARSDFIARTSHEIRTPLTGILAVTELLAQTTEPRDQQLLGETMRRSCIRLLQLVDNVLNFAAGNAAVDPHADEEHDLHAVIHDAAPLAEVIARTTG